MKIALGAAAAAWLIADDWLIALAVLVLAAIWIYVRNEVGPPVVQLALTLQWVTVCAGLFYVTATGRPLEATLKSDYRPMVVIGLATVFVLAAGVYLGMKLFGQIRSAPEIHREHAFTLRTLALIYAVGVAVVGTVQRIAWDYPSLTQAIIALSYLRLGVLYLILRRLVRSGRWTPVAAVLSLEIVLGATGFYAGFREPLIMAVLAVLEIVDRRSVKQWAALAALAVVMVALGVMWVSVRTGYRQRFLSDETFAASRAQRIDSIRMSAREWASRDPEEFAYDVDKFIDRLWAVYYPALAIERVPKDLPHAGGMLMRDALMYNFMPRILFPEKPALKSDSELVRKYSGVWVAGEEENTTIAFGYAAESYVDFGVPLMFVPVLVYGVFIGFSYRSLLSAIRHRDVAIALVTVIFWLSLYLFERSWVKTIGLSGTLLIYVGGVGWAFDRLCYGRAGQPEAEGEGKPAYDVAAAFEGAAHYE